MRYSRDLRQRQPSGQRTLTQRAIAILARYGTDASLFLPGVGAVNGIQAGNWLDSAGTVPAAINDPVGLVVNARGGSNATQPTTANKPVLSARYNLLTKTEQFDDVRWQRATSNGTAFPVVTGNYAVGPRGGMTASRVQLTLPGDTEWSLVRAVGPIASIPAGVAVTISVWIRAENPSQVGKLISLYAYNVSAATYATGNRVSKHILTNEWRRVESTFSFSAESNSQEFSIGKARGFVVDGLLNADTATDFLVWGAQFVFSDQSHLPYQRVNTATDYDADPAFFRPRWAFDGSNDSFATTLAPANAGFICTGANVSGAGTVRTLLGAGAGSDASSGVWLARQANNALTLHVGNGTARNSVAAAYPLASACVASAGWDAGSMLVGVNNTESTGAKTVNCASANTANIGVLTGTEHPMLGSIGPLIYIHNALPSASERAVLRRFVASLSGVLL